MKVVNKVYSKPNYHNDGSFDRWETTFYNNGTFLIEVVHYKKQEEQNPALFLDL